MTDVYAGVPREAEPLSGPTMFAQDWLDLLFLHWPVDPASVAHLYPPDTRPDVWHDGLTYVGLVPFRMSGAGFGPRVPVPFFGRFLEWNVRLYSVDDQGRHGVVFRSLDTDRLAIVAFARTFGIPYRYAHIATSGTTDDVTWRMRRRERPRPTSELRVRVGAPTEPTDLEVFLTSRWGMHSRVGHRTMWVQNHHGPWPLQSAELLHLDDGLVAAAGVEPAGEMLRPLWTRGVHSRFALPRLVPRSGSGT
ncbi:YqjF family protein [Jatrophihabitans fulvus]